MIQQHQMEENSPRFSRKEGTQQNSKVGPTTKNSRYTTTPASAATTSVDEGGDLIECSGKYCRSCTAGCIADCVALCCCPCALVNLFALAFVKVPWTVGRKCFGRVKKRRRRNKEIERKCKKSSDDQNTQPAEEDDTVVVMDKDGILRKRRAEDGTFDIVTNGFGEEDEMGGVSARFEAERVWLELYQDGHLGFGRVSFTGIQS